MPTYVGIEAGGHILLEDGVYGLLIENQPSYPHPMGHLASVLTDSGISVGHIPMRGFGALNYSMPEDSECQL